MASFVFDNVKAEKADAVRRFNRRRKFQELLPVIELALATLVLLYWLFSTWMPISGDCLRQLAGYLTSSVFVFVIVNALVIAIFSLSHLKKPAEHNLYDQYVSYTCGAASAAAAVEESPATEEKQIITVPAVANAASVSQAERETVHAVNSAKETVMARRETVSDVSSVRENIQGRQETVNAFNPARETVTERRETARDVSSVTEAVTARRQMLRAVTSVREAVRTGGGEMTGLSPRSGRAVEDVVRREYRRSRSERRWCAIDDLSSEEFRTTVETFIAAKRKTLLQETMAERRAADMALVVRN